MTYVICTPLLLEEIDSGKPQSNKRQSRELVKLVLSVLQLCLGLLGESLSSATPSSLESRL